MWMDFWARGGGEEPRYKRFDNLPVRATAGTMDVIL